MPESYDGNPIVLAHCGTEDIHAYASYMDGLGFARADNELAIYTYNII